MDMGIKTLGVDIGSLTTKIVLMESDSLKASTISRSYHNFSKSGQKIFSEFLQQHQITRNEIAAIFSTGYGRHVIPEITENVITEISAHAKGAQFFFPKTQSVIDIGGQDSKAIKIHPNTHKVIDFQMNDKCAAGTGRFLEVMAQALEVEISDLGNLALQADNPAKISSTCTVFAESEIIGLFAQGMSKSNIAMGIHHSIAQRVGAMVQRLRLKEPITFCGGVALNSAVKHALELVLNLKLMVPVYPQLNCAIGAALIAKEYITSSK